MLFRDDDTWLLFWFKTVGLTVLAFFVGLCLDYGMGVIEGRIEFNVGLITNFLLFVLFFVFLIFVGQPARDWIEKHRRKQ